VYTLPAERERVRPMGMGGVQPCPAIDDAGMLPEPKTFALESFRVTTRGPGAPTTEAYRITLIPVAGEGMVNLWLNP